MLPRGAVQLQRASAPHQSPAAAERGAFLLAIKSFADGVHVISDCLSVIMCWQQYMKNGLRGPTRRRTDARCGLQAWREHGAEAVSV